MYARLRTEGDRNRRDSTSSPVNEEGARQSCERAGTAAAPPAAFATLRRFRRGAFIVHGGGRAETVYLVRSGHVRVFLPSESGDEITCIVLGPGHVFGLAALLDLPVYHGFAEALTPVEAWALPADRLREQLPRDRGLLNLVVESLGRRLTLGQALLRGAALLPVAQRLQDLRDWLAPCLGGEQPRLTQELLGELVGARPETVCRAAQTARRQRLPRRAPCRA